MEVTPNARLVRGWRRILSFAEKRRPEWLTITVGWQEKAGAPPAPRPDRMIRIAISQAAFEAIAVTLSLGSVGYENATDEHGQRLIWLDHAVVARLRAVRGPGESYSDVILRLRGRRDQRTG